MQPSSHCCVNSSGSIFRRGRKRFPVDVASYKQSVPSNTASHDALYEADPCSLHNLSMASATGNKKRFWSLVPAKVQISAQPRVCFLPRPEFGESGSSARVADRALQKLAQSPFHHIII